MTVDLSLLTKDFPQEALKSRWADKNQTRKLTYVEGHVYIRRVNEATGNNWSMEVRDITSRDFGGGQLVMARVAVTIPEHGTREGIGVQAVHERGGEDLIKGALTDAVKNALKYFGVGLELYGPDYEADAPVSQPSRPQPRDSAPAPAREPVTQEREDALTVAAIGPDQLATQRQLRFLQAIARERGLGPEALDERSLNEFGTMAGSLTRRDCSSLIDLLQSEAGQVNGVTAVGEAPVAQTGGITEPQQKFVRGLMSEHGVSDELMHTMILVDYNAEHLRELTKEQASAYIKALQSLPIPEQQGIKQETQRGYEHNQRGVPEEPEWMRSAAGNDRYTA